MVVGGRRGLTRTADYMLARLVCFELRRSRRQPRGSRQNKGAPE